MRILLPIIVALSVVGCAGKRRVTVRPLPVPASETGGLRYPEMVGVYHVGRLIEPERSGQMHEAHPVYRIESESRWDLHPGVSLNFPSGEGVDVSYSRVPLNDSAVAELYRQQAISEALMREAAQLGRSYEDFKMATGDLTRMARDHALATGRLQSAEERLEKLEERLRRVEGSSPMGP